MSEPGQQRVMLRSDYGRASGFRHGSMLRRQGTSSLLYFVYTLLDVLDVLGWTYDYGKFESDMRSLIGSKPKA
jgi:hypothetical protein